MKTVELLRGQANEVYRAICDKGMSPTDFEWQKRKSRYDNDTEIPILTHTPTQYYFAFELNNKERICWCSPHAGFRDVGYLGKRSDWPGVMEMVLQWLDNVSTEHVEPDLWSTNDEGRSLIGQNFEETGNEPFSPVEQVRISGAVNELKQFLISTGEYSERQLQFIEHRLAHLEDSSKRLGRKDWITLAMGTLTNIIVGVALTPEASREFVRTANALFGWIMQNISLIN